MANAVKTFVRAKLSSAPKIIAYNKLDSHSSERFPLMSKYDAGNIILDKYLKMK